MLIGVQIGNHDPKMSVDEVKETLRQEMVAEFLAMNTGMGTGMDTKESLRREIMAEINTVLMGAGQNAKEYLREEMAAEIKAALIGVEKEGNGENTDARDEVRQDPTSSVNIIMSGRGDVQRRNGAKCQPYQYRLAEGYDGIE